MKYQQDLNYLYEFKYKITIIIFKPALLPSRRDYFIHDTPHHPSVHKPLTTV